MDKNDVFTLEADAGGCCSELGFFRFDLGSLLRGWWLLLLLMFFVGFAVDDDDIGVDCVDNE